MHRSPEMTALGAFRDGVGRVNRAPAVLLGVWLMTALSVLPIALAQTANPNPLLELAQPDSPVTPEYYFLRDGEFAEKSPVSAAKASPVSTLAPMMRV